MWRQGATSSHHQSVPLLHFNTPWRILARFVTQNVHYMYTLEYTAPLNKFQQDAPIMRDHAEHVMHRSIGV